jgi:hypothetical protein
MAGTNDNRNLDVYFGLHGNCSRHLQFLPVVPSGPSSFEGEGRFNLFTCKRRDGIVFRRKYDSPRTRLRWIQVVNESVFPVTVDQAGFLLKGTAHRVALTGPYMTLDNLGFPRRIEPRDAVTVFTNFPLPGNAYKAYVKTKCGHESTCGSKLLRLLEKGPVFTPNG